MTDKSDIGNRMKRYENVPRIYLTPRTPAIIRIDGKAFHTFTRGFAKPWDKIIRNCLTAAAEGLMENIQGAELAYAQSDEISILLNDYKRFDSQAWFDKNVQKMVSVSASIATAYFNQCYKSEMHNCLENTARMALFDSRVFVVPREEATNYFIWRQRDAVKNSISSLAQSEFSHKKLQNKNATQMKEMLSNKGIDWEACAIWHKRGWCVVRKSVIVGPADCPQSYGNTITENGAYLNTYNRVVVEADYEIPDFAKNRGYIDQYLEQIEE